MARLHERAKLDSYPLLEEGHSPLGAFRFALRGLGWAWRQERNFRIECAIGALALLLALLLRVNPVPIVLAATTVLSLELVNSALEATIDLVTPDFHPLAKIAKDVAASAVLVASLGAALVGLVTLGPALWSLLGSLLA